MTKSTSAGHPGKASRPSLGDPSVRRVGSEDRPAAGAQQQHRTVVIEAISTHDGEVRVVLDERAGGRIIAYESVDADCPPDAKGLAHWFDAAGRVQVATAVGPSAECCRDELTAFLNSAIAKANTSVATQDPARSAEMRRRVMIGVEKRRGRAALKGRPDG
jgi:hypothetical protein